MKSTLRERIITAMDDQGMSAAELQRRSGVSYDVITKLRHRPTSSTSAENGEKLLSALGLSEVVAALPKDDATHIPVYDVQASAGFGSLVDYEEQTHSLAFPPDYLKKLTGGSARDLVIISTKGDSMEPTLLDDDIVLVDTSKTHMGYEGMFVLRHNDTLLVKRAGMAARNGMVNLLSDNTRYPPIEARLDELHVVGKVLWYGRKV